MIKLKIDVKKIDKSALYQGAKGTYLDITLIENKAGEDQYGNSGFIVQEISQARREAGEKGPILGNWKHSGQKAQGRDRTSADAYKTVTQPPAPPKGGYEPDPADTTDDIPF
jgi:hypothetical protein